MTFTPLNFGKHQNKTLPQIVFSDLDYFIWAVNENIFKNAILQQEWILQVIGANILDQVQAYT